VDYLTVVSKLRESVPAFHPENESPEKIRQFIQPVEPIDAINWLQNIDLYPKFFWKDRSRSNEWAALGCAREISALQHPDFFDAFGKMQSILDASGNGVRFWGGMRFDAGTTVALEWQNAGVYRFVLPQFELRKEGNSAALIYNYITPGNCSKIEDINTTFSRLEYRGHLAKTIQNNLLQRQDEPLFEDWEKILNRSLAYLADHRFRKIVLARRSSFYFRHKIDPFIILRMMQSRNTNSFCFLFQLDRNFTFLGVTPEELYSRSGRRILCDAIAGTALRGSGDEEDDRLGRELLGSEKDMREHRWVVQALEACLNNLCVHWNMLNEETLLKLTYVQHIITRFRGSLKENITDAEIIREMHPTPAVAGFPKEDAIQYISRLEKFDRGWYAGPVGWLSGNEAQFAVALRSALIDQKKLITYAGAGIVTGSHPAREWQEMENKLLNYTRLFENL